MGNYRTPQFTWEKGKSETFTLTAGQQYTFRVGYDYYSDTATAPKIVHFGIAKQAAATANVSAALPAVLPQKSAAEL